MLQESSLINILTFVISKLLEYIHTFHLILLYIMISYYRSYVIHIFQQKGCWGEWIAKKKLKIIARGGAIIVQKKWLLQMKKTFSSHDRKMKRIIPKHNESSWCTLERSHAEGERKKDETSLSHRHHKNFSFIHSYI